jgi:hypothetical protein
MAHFWEDRGHCPACGKFCKNIIGTANSEKLVKVEGTCKIHGVVDLTDQSWSYEDFFDD